ncbi:MAG: hypothetical protein IPP74_13450 [Alphaproteobacteria bacterium]|nr:hypothetical protein [Alphaproteobacteria bacterium]
MTITSDVLSHIYNGDDSNIYWAYTFKIIETTDITVSITSPEYVKTTLTSNYEVDTFNSRVIYPTPASGLDPLPTGWTITLERIVPVTQELDLTEQGTFSAEDVETALDKMTMICQQLQTNTESVTTVIALGDQSTNGSWRIVISNGNLSFQRLESGNWSEKGAVTP